MLKINNMTNLSFRKLKIMEQADKFADTRDEWIKRNSYYYKSDHSYTEFLVGEGKRVIELGSGTGQLLNAIKPSYGVGVDISSNMVEVAKKNFPHLITFL